MGIIAPTYDDRVRYTLSHNEYGSLVITEPVGWKEDEKEYARNNDYHGIFAKFSNNLKFVGNGAEFIQNAYAIHGINAVIKLIRDEQHPQTDRWTRSYEGFLDMSTYQLEKGQVSIKFNSGGIEQILKTRDSDDVEIERERTIEGSVLPELETKETHLEGRRIFLKSRLEITECSTNREAKVSIESNAGGTRNQTVGIPLQAVVNSHQDLIQSVTPQSNGIENMGNLGMMVMFDSQRERVMDIDLQLSFDAFVQQHENVDWGSYHVCITKYKNGFDFDLAERIDLYRLEDVHPWFGNDLDYPAPQFTWPISASYQNNAFQLLQGESLAVECYVKADFHTDNNAGVRVFAQNILARMIVEENSVFPASDTKTVLAHDLGERLLHILTNRKNILYSKALGRTQLGYQNDGFAALTGFSHGMWIRQFDKEGQLLDPCSTPFESSEENEERNRYKPFTTSFKDYMQSLSAIWNLGMGIEKIGYSERVRIEPLSYFYNRNITIKLPNQVQKVKRTIAKDWYFSALEVGYEKGGEYEEAMGLDEYNGKSKFNTCITAIKKTFSAVSKYRSDSYGMEFARRKPKYLNETEDTSYDQDIFAMDLKRWIGDERFKQRKWQDDFEEEPSGVFSPETATNLRFSPMNLLLRHAWVVASGLVKYPMDYVRFGSSSANSKLTTQLEGGIERVENEDIINSELVAPRFVPEWVEFEHQLDFDLNQKLEGKTIINGEEIPNFYGRIQFLNENNEWEKGYLFSVKPNDGKWKLLKAHR